MLKLIPSLAEHIDAFIEMERRSDTTQFIIPYTKAQHKTEMRKQDINYLSILSHDALSGFFILARQANREVEFRRIVVDSNFRGIGQQAIVQMEQYCMAHFDTQRIWLDVFESNQRGLHIYNKLGYKQFKTSLHQGKPLILMEKYL
ncbi:GNAT family N-acetyltransferase [Pseudoalteromonas luteoviolacea]|uniref:GNAT family N-acetyltransferase n=1 Tax=Pseudoalteromonas luteoviolacea TaxID=43657 RepID=UPI001F227C65|nr:GNAT family N-acetyltransferase [Pseudoalteromonas luteoviolacea]MCF6440759.1 GNAT family N-acetyltransferase [Pseudoalteromonas luteoviolacea]